MAKQQSRTSGEGADQPGDGSKRSDLHSTPASVEETLQKSERRLSRSHRLARHRLAGIETIYNSMHVGLCVFDRKLRYVRINERLARINGLPAAAHLGKTVREVVPDLARTAEALAARVFRTGEPVLDVEFSGTTPAQPDVQRRWVEHWLPLKDEAGKVIGINVVIHEITEHERTEQAPQEANERLQVQAEELQAQQEELQAQAEELHARAEELAAANEELRRSEERLRQRVEEVETLMKVVPVAIWVSDDPQCNHIVGNPTADGFYEAAERENVSANVSPARRFFRGGRELTPLELPMQQAAARNIDIRNADLDVLLPSGTWRNLLGSSSPLRDARGQVRGCVGAFLDITEHRQAEEALRRAHEDLQAQSEELAATNEELRVQSVQLQESEQRLRLALAGGRMGRWEWDLAADTMFWCERAYDLLGVDKRCRPRIATLLECIYPEDRQAAKDLIAQAINEAADFQAEFRVLHQRHEPRSEIAWLALHAKVIRDAQERAIRTIGVLYDITPRKQMEAELRRLNERLQEEVQVQTEELRGMIDRLQDEVVRRVLAEGKLRKSSRMLEAFFQHTTTPLAFLDRQFNFVRVNEAFARADGRDPEFFVRQNCFALYPSEENRAIFEQVVRAKEPYHARARLFAFSAPVQQTLRYWNWHLTPLQDDAGRLQFLVFNLEDVTEQRQAFGELEHRAHLLQKLTLELAQAEDRERRRLAEILHDDLQQMLAAAKFHLGLLNSRIRGDEPAEELSTCLGKMLKDAIEMSRSLSHELSPAVLYQGDLGETFEWLARQVQAKHGLTVHTEVHGRVDTSSEPIKAFLFRAAQEILFNTVKHARVNEARLRLQRRRGQLWLTIADRGRGFDPTTLGQTGGFGLFSLRERVGLLGGRMRIRSAKDKGSVLVIAVADAQDAADGGQKTEDNTALPGPSPEIRPPSSGSRLRILLVDDHKTMREGLAALIGVQPDMEVVGQAGDGRKAIELAPRLAPDVVIMDVAMPTVPGDEATRRIKTILPQTRIVALSMFEEPGVAQQMREAGADDYLSKSGPSETLLAAIRGQR